MFIFTYIEQQAKHSKAAKQYVCVGWVGAVSPPILLYCLFLLTPQPGFSYSKMARPKSVSLSFSLFHTHIYMHTLTGKHILALHSLNGGQKRLYSTQTHYIKAIFYTHKNTGAFIHGVMGRWTRLWIKCNNWAKQINEIKSTNREPFAHFIIPNLAINIMYIIVFSSNQHWK